MKISDDPPITRRRITSNWGELDYLCQKTRYWLYLREKKSSAGRYTGRLAKVFRELPTNEVAILREEGFALLYELKGDFGKAIAHREREIHLMEQLHREASSPRYDDKTRAYMLRERESTDLAERRLIVESLKK
jgi:hypothetical protein